MKAAAIIGHDTQSAGAYSPYLKKSEYLYNTEVASYLHCFDVYKRPLAAGYSQQMRLLANEVNKYDYDLVFELHFNAFNKKANGCEVVIFPNNQFTKNLGDKYCKKITEHYGTTNRGVKEATVGGRGYDFLRLMKAPAMIVEPFFGDHLESLKFKNEMEYANLISEWIYGSN